MKQSILLLMGLLVTLFVGCGGYGDDYSDVPIAEEVETPEISDIPEIPQEVLLVEPAEYELEAPAEVSSRRVVSVSAASNHTLALAEDGTLWAWGTEIWAWDGDGYQQHTLGIGDGTREIRNRPVQIMENVTFALAATHHSLAITNDGALWTWGNNYFGQLGDGTNEHRLSPVRAMEDVIFATMLLTAPNSHTGISARTYAIQSDGSLWAWGDSGWGSSPFDVALGDGGTENRNTPVRILENAVSVAATDNGGYAVTNDGRLWGWHGEITISHFDDETQEWSYDIIVAQRSPVPIMEDIASLCPRGTHAITTNGALWALERQGVGELLSYHAVSAAVNGEARFVVYGCGTLWAQGRNRLPDHWRQGPLLGDGTTTDREIPVQICYYMGSVASITSMGNATYAIATDGTLWAWGNNGGALGSGILGDGTIFSWDDIEEHMWDFHRTEVSWGEREDGVLWLLDDDGGTGVRLSPVKIMENVASITTAYFMFDHGWIRGFRTFAITENGELWAWGENAVEWQTDHENQSWLGDGSWEMRLSPVRIILPKDTNMV